MLLAAAYFPPIEYFAAMAAGFTLSADRVNPSVVYVEACENYQKQSWRNRCGFYAESGIQYLNFPVRHHRDGSKVPIKEVLVDYSTPWVERHKRAIVSAYRTSAYFEYYQDELFSIMDSCPETLFELNTRILMFFIEKTGIYADLRETASYEKQEGVCEEPGSPWKSLGLTESYGIDLRQVIHPKHSNDILSRLQLEKPYFQVFARKHGFVPDLSIMDLLFNEGPDSILYLKSASSLRLPVRI